MISVIPFDDVDEALRLANDTPYGLAGGVWTRNLSTAHRWPGHQGGNDLGQQLWRPGSRVRLRRLQDERLRLEGRGRDGGQLLLPESRLHEHRVRTSAVDSETKPPRPSATIVFLREDASRRVEALMVQRADRGDQNSLRWVFPGGLVDATDQCMRARFHLLDDAAASARIGIDAGGLDYWAAALRETLEEARFAAGRGQGRPGHRRQRAAGSNSILACPGTRTAARRSGTGVCRLVRRARVAPAGPRRASIAHWITPMGMPKRFDTIFFVASAPAGQAVDIDGDARRPPVGADSGAGGRARGVEIRGPTLAVANDLVRFASVTGASGLGSWRGTARSHPASAGPQCGRRVEAGAVPAHRRTRRIGARRPAGPRPGARLHPPQPGRATRGQRIVRLTPLPTAG